MPDIVIGAADTFDVPDVRNWVNSLKASGFAGDIWLITYRVTAALKAFLAERGVNEYAVEHDPYERPIMHAAKGSPTQAHNLRFYHAWELLTRLGADNYKHVIMTDVRDVIFQRNPSEYFNNLFYFQRTFIAPSEGIKFGKEEWNMNNLESGFGRFFVSLNKAESWNVYNVGTIAGLAVPMANLFHTIFSMTEGRFYPADQSAFNVLCHTTLQTHACHQDMNVDSWAAQMGTTNDPTKSHLWERLHETRPKITSDGIVTNPWDVVFTLVHQYDRVPGLKEIINERYK